MQIQNLISIKDAARIVGIDVATLRYHVEVGNLRAVKVFRDLGIEPQELSRFMAARGAGQHKPGRPRKQKGSDHRGFLP